MAAFIVSSFGMFVMSLFQGLFPAPSWQTFVVLAWGWALTSERHTLTSYLWLTGAVTLKHFSRFYVFLGGALYKARWQLWARLIWLAAQWGPAEAPIVIVTNGASLRALEKRHAEPPSCGLQHLCSARRTGHDNGRLYQRVVLSGR